MEINTPHFNAIVGELLSEDKKSYSAKKAHASKKYGSKEARKKVAGAVLKKLRKGK